jgi:hypothetical protein
MNCAMMKVRCKVPLSRATGAHVHIPESVQYTIIIFFSPSCVFAPTIAAWLQVIATWVSYWCRCHSDAPMEAASKSFSRG